MRNVTPAQLISNRDLVMSIWRRGGKGYLRRGAADDTPLSSLYRLYHFIVTDDTIELRNELEFFFNKDLWAVCDIPDPHDMHPERYAILAVMPALMVRAFNRLIERGLPRNSPAIILDFEELARQPKILEKVPPWTYDVPKLEPPLKIPNANGEFVHGPDDPNACKEFLDKGILIEEPHIYFV